MTRRDPFGDDLAMALFSGVARVDVTSSQGDTGGAPSRSTPRPSPPGGRMSDDGGARRSSEGVTSTTADDDLSRVLREAWQDRGWRADPIARGPAWPAAMLARALHELGEASDPRMRAAAERATARLCADPRSADELAAGLLRALEAYAPRGGGAPLRALARAGGVAPDREGPPAAVSVAVTVDLHADRSPVARPLRLVPFPGQGAA